MKNFTDDGKIHFDASTAQLPVSRRIERTIHGHRYVLDLLIPLTIAKSLSSADYVAAESLMDTIYAKHFTSAILRGLQGHKVHLATRELMKIDVCEFLYNQFTLQQHARGNQTWQVPPTMQDVRRTPEEDFD